MKGVIRLSSRVKKIKGKTKGKTVLRSKVPIQESIRVVKKHCQGMSHDEIIRYYESLQDKVRQRVVDSIHKYGEEETVERLIEELGEFVDCIDVETGEITEWGEKEKRLLQLMIREEEKLTEEDKKEIARLRAELE